MAQGASHQDLRQDRVFQALSHEAAVAAELIASGATLIGKASVNHQGIYSQAFFSLSNGMERAAKLAFVLDHAIAHDGKFPTNQMLKEYGHDLSHLFVKMDEIAQRNREHGECDLALPSTEIHQGIIETLSEFGKMTRYYNLSYLGGADATTLKEPIGAWYERVGKPVLAKHYSQARRKSDAQKARAVHGAVGEAAFVLLSSESGESIDTIESLEVNAAQVRVIQPYARMYTLQIARFLGKLITGLQYRASKMGLPNIPALTEFFRIFNNDDQYFKRRRTWSIYAI